MIVLPATYERIATTTLGSAAANITFSSIPATYTHLILSITGRTTSGSSTALRVELNSDTGSNYSFTRVGGTGSAAFSERFTSQTSGYLGDVRITQPGYVSAHIFNYAGSTNKTWLSEASADENGSGLVIRNVGLWRSTSAITTILIRPNSGNLETGLKATLYGIKRA